MFGLIEVFSGRLLHQGIDGRSSGQSYLVFLTTVLDQTTEPLFLAQDGAPYHRAAPVQAFFEQRRDRLHVIRMPSYSPEYNPVEFLWRPTKRVAPTIATSPSSPTRSPRPMTPSRPSPADPIASADDALAAFARRPDRVTTFIGRYPRLLADSDAAALDPEAEIASCRTISDAL